MSSGPLAFSPVVQIYTNDIEGVQVDNEIDRSLICMENLTNTDVDKNGDEGVKVENQIDESLIAMAKITMDHNNERVDAMSKQNV